MIESILIFILFRQEGDASKSFILDPSQAGFEPTIINLALWLKLGIEIIGAIIILIGILCAVYELIQEIFLKQNEGFIRVRLLLARHLALALEFQLAADILSTAIAPSWEQIGKLAAIAIIRTALNYFLRREMREEKKSIESENTVVKSSEEKSET